MTVIVYYKEHLGTSKQWKKFTLYKTLNENTSFFNKFENNLADIRRFR